MLLSYNELCRDVVAEKVVRRRDGTGIPLSQVNSSSIDITLGRRALREKPQTASAVPRQVLDYAARDPLPTEPEVIGDEGIVLWPGQFLLTETEEMFFLPLHLSFEYKLKSSMARIGLEHLTAGWADAGWHSSVLTLELKNLNQHHPIRLRRGDPIGQLTFFQHSAVPYERSYAARGRYNFDDSVSNAKATP